MTTTVLSFLLVFVPLSLGLKYLVGAPSVWIFIAAVVAVAVLAEWIRRATAQLAERIGPAVGGLLAGEYRKPIGVTFASGPDTDSGNGFNASSSG